MGYQFGVPTADQEALQAPAVEPSDFGNAFKSLLGLLSTIPVVAGTRYAFSPLLKQAWIRGDELAALQDKIRVAPNAYGFNTARDWRKSLSTADQDALFLRDQSGKRIAQQAVREQNMLEQITPPSATDLETLKTRTMYPVGESLSAAALGLNQYRLARKRGK